MIQLLADTAAAAPDTMVSTNAITAILTVLFSGASLLIGKILGRREAKNILIKEPMPEVPTRKVSTPPSWSDHKALSDRVNRTEADIMRLETEQRDLRELHNKQFNDLMKAGENRAFRISETLSNKIDDVARSIHLRIDEILRPTKR